MLQFILFLSLIAASAASCNRICGKTMVQYPFGFSPSCHIQLSCNSTSGISFSGFPVQNFTTNHTFSVNISTDCNRSVDTASAFFSTNYALTHRSGLFLRNCNQSVTQPCLLPTLVVSQMSHQVQNCSRKDNNLTCFFNNTGNMYLTKGMVSKTSCRDLFTSVLYEPNLDGQMALVFGLVEIGWWMTGERRCAANATWTPVRSEVKDGYWCKCNNGFIGDGFAEGEGCHRVTSTSAADCARSIVGGIAGGTAVLVCLILLCLVCCHHLKTTSSSAY